MTPREPSETAKRAALDAYAKAHRWSTGNKRAMPADAFAMEAALRAAYAVDFNNNLTGDLK